MPSRSRSSASRRRAGLVGLADQVVVRVDRLDDAGRERHVTAPDVVGPAVRLGLLGDDRRDGVEDAGLPDDVGAEVGDAALVGRRGHHGRTTGDRLGERELADVVHQRGVLQVAQVGVAHAQLAADRDGHLADPAGVPGLGVAAELGDPRQRADRLQRRLADRGVPAERELGEQQRHDEDGQRPGPHDAGRQGEQRTGGADRGADAGLGPDLVAQHRDERRPVGSGPHRSGERPRRRPG